MTSQKILLAEDDQFLGRIYAQTLQAEGFEVTVVTTGEEALRLAKRDAPDLILLDVILPKMDGFETLEKLKQESFAANIPVVIMSNLGQKEDVLRGASLGAAGYIIKAHTSPVETLAVIRRALE